MAARTGPLLTTPCCRESDKASASQALWSRLGLGGACALIPASPGFLALLLCSVEKGGCAPEAWRNDSRLPDLGYEAAPGSSQGQWLGQRVCWQIRRSQGRRASLPALGSAGRCPKGTGKCLSEANPSVIQYYPFLAVKCHVVGTSQPRLRRPFQENKARKRSVLHYERGSKEKY